MRQGKRGASYQIKVLIMERLTKQHIPSVARCAERIKADARKSVGSSLLCTFSGQILKPGNNHREAYTGKHAGRSEECPLQGPFSPVRSLEVDGDVVTCAEASTDSIVKGEMKSGLPGFAGRGMYVEKRTRT